MVCILQQQSEAVVTVGQIVLFLRTSSGRHWPACLRCFSCMDRNRVFFLRSLQQCMFWSKGSVMTRMALLYNHANHMFTTSNLWSDINYTIYINIEHIYSLQLSEMLLPLPCSILHMDQMLHRCLLGTRKLLCFFQLKESGDYMTVRSQWSCSFGLINEGNIIHIYLLL